MSNANAFPGYVNTSTTTTTTIGTTTTKIEPLIWFDSSYIHTRPGQLKIAAIVSTKLIDNIVKVKLFY